MIKLCDSIKEIQKTGNLKFQEQDRKFKKHTYRKNPDLNFRAEFGNFQIGYIRAWQSFELIHAIPMFVKHWRNVCFKENIHWKIEHIVNIPKVQKHLKSYNLRKQKSFVKCSINEVGTFWPKIFLFLDLDHIVISKGQLISKCLLGVIDFPKNQRKIWQISALESKNGSNQQGKSTFL